ncbi:MAG TPA: alpha/beta fold hydrolase [Steroidobacteraceae bacterium]|nr:alpha/beta fold hydrolase [Steroidobacteraceae bacterium]
MLAPQIDIDESFRPPRWLSNPHLQTVLPSLPARRRWIEPAARAVLEASRELLLDCGDGVRLQALHARPRVAKTPLVGEGRATEGAAEGAAEGRTAVLVHGWEGSADSMYVLSLAQQLFERGFEVVRLNLRDHGPTHHLNKELFHSCRLPEVVGALRQLQALVGGKPLHLAGFSLGGNFMLRAAAQARDSGLTIARVVAISPVLDPAATLDAMERSCGPYHGYFVRKWTQSLGLKQAAWPGIYDFAELRRAANLRRMTAELVGRFTEFASLEDYLQGYAIVGSRLAPLAVPATIIAAQDDPIIPARDLVRLAPVRTLRVILTRRGGHCGFVRRLFSWTWAERRAAEELDSN